jgi:Leucine-rich repeat (LRR) protein
VAVVISWIVIKYGYNKPMNRIRIWMEVLYRFRLKRRESSYNRGMQRRYPEYQWVSWRDEEWKVVLWLWARENGIRDILDNHFYFRKDGYRGKIVVPPQYNLTSVTFLDLRHKNHIEIPKEIGNLVNLKTLYLDSNVLNMPDEVCNLTNLTALYIFENKFICPEEISNILANPLRLTWGRERDLACRYREYTRDEIDTYRGIHGKLYDRSSMPEYEVYSDFRPLYLNGNPIAGISINNPPDPYGFSEVAPGNVDVNWIRGLLQRCPKEIGNLVNLTTLDLNNNQLTELPKEIGNLVNLTSLDLSGNQLTELPKEIGNLVNLTTLYLGVNQLTELPKEITNLVNLTMLSLNDNQLTELPKEIGNLVNLIELDLRGNQLTELPKEITKKLLI